MICSHHWSHVAFSTKQVSICCCKKSVHLFDGLANIEGLWVLYHVHALLRSYPKPDVMVHHLVVEICFGGGASPIQ
jgi:hypothetical protein